MTVAPTLPVPLASASYEVTAQRITEYASAIVDPNPRYQYQGRDTSHMVAPPGLAAAFMQDPVRELFADTERLEKLGIDGGRVVFGEVAYSYGPPLRPGEWVQVAGWFTSREAKGSREVLSFRTVATRDDESIAVSADITFIQL